MGVQDKTKLSKCLDYLPGQYNLLKVLASHHFASAITGCKFNLCIRAWVEDISLLNEFWKTDACKHKSFKLPFIPELIIPAFASTIYHSKLSKAIDFLFLIQNNDVCIHDDAHHETLNLLEVQLNRQMLFFPVWLQTFVSLKTFWELAVDECHLVWEAIMSPYGDMQWLPCSGWGNTPTVGKVL